MNVLNAVLGGDVTRLRKNSEAIVDVFTKTVDKLTKVNSEIEITVKERNAQIDKLTDERVQLNDIKSGNEKIIGKLNSILKD